MNEDFVHHERWISRNILETVATFQSKEQLFRDLKGTGNVCALNEHTAISINICETGLQTFCVQLFVNGMKRRKVRIAKGGEAYGRYRAGVIMEQQRKWRQAKKHQLAEGPLENN